MASPPENRCVKSLRKVEDKVLSYDLFEDKIQLMLPDGKASYQTWKGCFFSIIVAISLIFFASAQYIKMVAKDDTDVMISKRD